MTQISFARSGVPGLDSVLSGGWPAGHMYLVLGYPGTGKTTLALQFLLEGVRCGEPVLYITLSETASEVRTAAASHGWSLDGMDLYELTAAQEVLGLDEERTMFDPSDVEFRETNRAILDTLDRVKPKRVVFDSLSELALLARESLAFRREVLLLKRKLLDLGATALLLSDCTSPDSDRQLQSLTHGVVTLEEVAPDFGGERRRMRVTKLRATSYRGGYHDLRILTGGITVFPRLVAAEHDAEFDSTPLSSGVEQLDALLGGGLDPGTSTLLMGPAGCGKSSIMMQFAHAAVRSIGPATVFLFDERLESMLHRSHSFGLPVHEHIRAGKLRVHQVDPGQLSPGELAVRIRKAVMEDGSRFVAIDSLNGYLHAMSGERDVPLQLHELLSFLDGQGVISMMLLAQQGHVTAQSSPIDVTYIADTVIITRFFEHGGRIRRALSVAKRRRGPHEDWIREFKISSHGIDVGEPLRSFHGLFTGAPVFTGERGALLQDGGDG
jgi:circadian clock protein KaiC